MSKDSECKMGHCWHVLSSWTNGLAESGTDSEQCCHCGKKREHKWRVKPSKVHGPHVQVHERVYTDD